MKRVICARSRAAAEGSQIGRNAALELIAQVCSPIVEQNELRQEFPVLRAVAYLNAGTDGPLPAQAVHAAARELEREGEEGRARAHFERRSELNATLRAAYAGLLGCDRRELALTTCTSEGMAQVIGGLELAAGDEIVTSDEEHPGLLGALGAAQALRGWRCARCRCSGSPRRSARGRGSSPARTSAG